MNEYFELIAKKANEILEMAEQEIKNSETSKWKPNMLKNVICKETYSFEWRNTKSLSISIGQLRICAL